jgi:Concanavalin A-like lectin/glucanases superfamily
MKFRLGNCAALALVALVAAAQPAPARAASTNHAAALRWPGSVDTDLAYADFFNKSFTITARFMPQYPRAYPGPFVSATDAKGSFELGLADYRSHIPGVKLALKLDGNEYYFYSAALTARKWQHVALVRTFTSVLSPTYGSSLALYINGQRACATAVLQCVDSIWIPGSGPAAPGGTLRIGRTDPSRNAVTQFYGFVDDVAVFSKALSGATIESLAARPRLDGDEASLLRAWTFDDATPSGATLPATLNHSAPLNQGAATAVVSQTRSDADADALPKPNWFETGLLRLPFKAGQAWRIAQGYATDGSHNGYAAFSYDFTLAGQQTPDKPVNTHAHPGDPSCGEPIYAARSGTMVYAHDTGGGGPDDDDYDGPNFLVVSASSTAHVTYMHTTTGSISAAFNNIELPPWNNPIDIDGGRQLATVGTRNRCHLHLSISNSTGNLNLNPLGPAPNLPDVTYPAGFWDYQACDADKGKDCTQEGNWYDAVYDVPRTGQWVRAK